MFEGIWKLYKDQSTAVGLLALNALPMCGVLTIMTGVVVFSEGYHTTGSVLALMGGAITITAWGIMDKWGRKLHEMEEDE